MATEIATFGIRKAKGLAERKKVLMYGYANNTLTLTKTQTGLDEMEAVVGLALRADTATALTPVLTTFNANTAVITVVDGAGDSANATVYCEIIGYRRT